MLIARTRSTRSPRFSMRLNCQVVRQRDFKLVATSVMNVSETGLFVDGEAPVRFGERLILTFYSPAVRSWIDAEGTVTRVSFGPRWMGRKQAFGVAFDTLDAASRKQIRRSMAALA
ncbi:MAG: PilZ domain-containing protein [Polyangiaceae bacterium]